LDLDGIEAEQGYDPRDDIRKFPRLLTEATGTLQAADYELDYVRKHQRLLAALLTTVADRRAIAQAVEECEDLGPLESVVKDMFQPAPERPRRDFITTR
ncbi:MAG TPA: hypothetical protein VM580_07095, partial [Labilithrix sp.]|nr:hypothetical protein [Labilithrix sp.]